VFAVQTARAAIPASVFFFRTGQNWATAPTSAKARPLAARIGRARSFPGAFITTSRVPRVASLVSQTSPTVSFARRASDDQSVHKVEVAVPGVGDVKDLVRPCARQFASRARSQSLP